MITPGMFRPSWTQNKLLNFVDENLWFSNVLWGVFAVLTGYALLAPDLVLVISPSTLLIVSIVLLIAFIVLRLFTLSSLVMIQVITLAATTLITAGIGLIWRGLGLPTEYVGMTLLVSLPAVVIFWGDAAELPKGYPDTKDKLMLLVAAIVVALLTASFNDFAAIAVIVTFSGVLLSACRTQEWFYTKLHLGYTYSNPSLIWGVRVTMGILFTLEAIALGAICDFVYLQWYGYTHAVGMGTGTLVGAVLGLVWNYINNPNKRGIKGCKR